MPTFGRTIVLMLTAVIMTGCVAGQSLDTTYQPAEAVPVNAMSGTPVAVSITDNRPYVINGDKPPYYLGKYRAGFGNPWDVTTDNKEPLAEVLRRDLSTELVALGYRVAEPAASTRVLSVSIVDWNFDGYQNGKFWYELAIRVSSTDGQELSNTAIRDSKGITGTVWTGAKGGFEREMPKLYADAIRRIVRENAQTRAALAAE